MITVGIESSCDDTAVAIIDQQERVRANLVSSQDTIHARYGGIVPELASRRHVECIHLLFNQALQAADCSLSDIGLITATQGPGLIGSLLVGFSFAKALAYSLDRPLVGVDHLTGHLLSPFLEERRPAFPYIALIVSGGTSALYRVEHFEQFGLLGRTRDDAAGEAFDKVARLLELGYPGGAAISLAAAGGDPDRIALPRAWLEEHSLDFSFSGLKTAVLNYCNQARDLQQSLPIADLCAAFQESVIDVLVEKTVRAAHRYSIDTIVIGGGVAANARLRERLAQRCADAGLSLHLPSHEHCTDNAAMIAYAGLQRYRSGIRTSLDADVFSRSHLGQ